MILLKSKSVIQLNQNMKILKIYKNVNLKHTAQREHKKENNRNRKVIWFNPPYRLHRID